MSNDTREDRFTWVATFRAVSDWLVNFENKQPELIKILNEIGIENGLEDRDSIGNTVRLEEIDPFTFFSMFMKYGIKARKEFFAKLVKRGGLKTKSPMDFDGVPSAQAQSVWLFPYKYSRENDTIKTLWSVFKNARNQTLDEEIFKKALAIPNTGFAKLTECLFYAFPDLYLPIDKQTRPWLERNGINIPDQSWLGYKQCLESVKKQFSKTFPELSFQAVSENQSAMFNALKATGYLQERFKGTQSGTIHLIAFSCINGRELAFDPGPTPENKKQIKVFLSKEPIDKTQYKKIVEYTAEKGRNNHLKQHAPSLSVGNRVWSVTIESQDQLEKLCNWYSEEEKMELAENRKNGSQLQIVKPPLNQILYGPPGTGKTYQTVSKAVRIIDPGFYLQNKDDRSALKGRFDELRTNGRIGFVTFHQSFSYEDFVEGLKAQADDNGTIRYDVEDGVFKTICSLASSSVQKGVGKSIDLSAVRVWKMSLGNTLTDDANIFDECIENDYVLLGYGKSVDFTGADTKSKIVECFKEGGFDRKEGDYGVTSVNLFKNKIKAGDIVVISDGNKKFRAIAQVTGDYRLLDSDERDGYLQCRNVEWLKVFDISRPIEELFNKSLSQMTIYELKPKTVKHDVLSNMLAHQKNSSQQASKAPYVLIIDEINRGNIAKIFGELITLIEPSKRLGAPEGEALSVRLPYSKNEFYVPFNLYVIGTMNTADRSLAQLDIALRRRFSFEELMPDLEILGNLPSVNGIDIGKMVQAINMRIELLYDREHTIGHSHFMVLSEDPTVARLADIFEGQILPLLEEYFFEDWRLIAQVLGDNFKPAGLRFIKPKFQSSIIASLMGSDWESQNQSQAFTRNLAAFQVADAYIGIYETMWTDEVVE